MATTKTTASADPAELTANPAVAEEMAGKKATAKITGYDEATDASTVQVTGLHDKALTFEMPGHPTEEHLISLVTEVSESWQREEDRNELITTNG